MEPITRQEQFLNSIATGNSVELEPITREEMYLSAIAGSTDLIPEKPITRKEMFYEKILESGGVGGGGSNTLKNIVAPTDTTGLERVVIIESEEQSMIFYRVADFVPFDRYKGCEILCHPEPGAPLEWIIGGEESETAKLLETGSYTDAYAGLIGVAQDNETIEISDGMAFTFPKAGIYFLRFNDSFLVQEIVFAEPTQTKTIDVVENGTYKVTPDSGKVLSSVTANVNVPERYDEGFAEGKEEGYNEGYNKGLADNEPVLEALTATENKEYTPSDNVDGFSSVTVNVPLKYNEGFQAGVDSVKLQEKTATENGDVLPDEGFNGMSKVTVAVPTSGGGKEEQEKSVTITENGTTEVTPDEGKTLSKVTVETNVSGGDISLGYTLNSDGTYTPINAEKDTTVPMGSDWLVKLVFVSDKTYTVDEMLGHSIRKMKLTRKALYLESIQEVEITADSVMPIEDGWTIIDSSVGIPLICVVTESIAGKDVGFGFPLPSNVGTYLTYADTKPDIQDNVIASISVKKAIRKPYIDTSMLEYFVGFFQYNHLLVNFINNLDVSCGTNFKSMFQSTKIEIIPPLNTIRGTAFDFMFYSSGVKEIQSLNLSNLQTGSSMFSNCSKLETINIVGETTNIKASYALEFPDSSALKNITIPQGWKNYISISKSKVVTVESLHGMIENLADLTGATAQTLQVGATNLAKIDEDHIAMLQVKNWNYS